jgi:hypothetical protein
MIENIKRWLSIKKEKNARGLILLSIIVFNILIWLISSLIAYAFAPGHYGTLVTALWESGITWMLEPGFYDPTVDYSIRIISIIVILLSMITFSGGIIGYVANLFSSIIDHSKEGKGKLYIYDHILILNWNQKALELIVDYCYTDEITHIVVLSNQEKEIIEKEIERKLYDIKNQIKKKIKVIVRTGEVFSKSDLMDLKIERAKAILILADEENSKQNHQYDDILSMKTLMLISNLNLLNDQTIIVEIKKQETKKLMMDHIAKKSNLVDQIIPLLPDELMGRLIAQTILMPNLNGVYGELFSFKGAEFYTIKNQTAIDYIQNFNHAIPIYEHKDFLYVLSSDQKDIYKKRSTSLKQYKPIKIRNQTRYKDRNLLIFGHNRKLEYILDSLKLYEKENQTKVQVTLVESNDVKVIEETTSKIDKIDTILILSEDHLDRRDYDADVLLTLLLTQEIAKKHQAEIVIELLDPKHYDIAKSYNIRNTIISNEYISRIMTQLSKNRRLYDLYEDLLTYDAIDSEEETFEVYAYLAKDIFMNSFPMSFSSVSDFIYSCYQSGENNYIMVGLERDGILKIFSGNMDIEEELIIQENDVVITICK